MNNQTTMMNRQLFEEYANDCGVQMAVDIARSCGVDAAMINRWTDNLLAAMCDDVAGDDDDDGYGIGVEAAYPITAQDVDAFEDAFGRI